MDAEEVAIMIPVTIMLMEVTAEAAADVSLTMTMRPAVGGRIGVFFLMYETRRGVCGDLISLRI